MLTLMHKIYDPEAHKTVSALQVHGWSEEWANSSASPCWQEAADWGEAVEPLWSFS